jgi:hypothetical protein
MIDKYEFDDKHDKSHGIMKVISEFRIKNSQMVISSGMVSVYPVPIRILPGRFKVPEGEVSQ